VNLGLPGAAPQQYFRYFERFGLELKPKLLVFGIFAGNDLIGEDNFHRWEAAGSPGNFAEWQSTGGRSPSQLRILLEHSLVLQTLKSAYRNIDPSQRAHTITTPDDGEMQLVPSLYRRTLALSDPSTPAFRSVVRSAMMARDLARAHGIGFLVVLFPTKESVYLPLRDIEFPALSRPIAAALEAEGIEVINLSEDFRRHAADSEALFFRIDGHPNVAGNRFIAELLQPRLQSALARLPAPVSGED
jgi:hypothetical protein